MDAHLYVFEEPGYKVWMWVLILCWIDNQFQVVFQNYGPLKHKARMNLQVHPDGSFERD